MFKEDTIYCSGCGMDWPDMDSYIKHLDRCKGPKPDPKHSGLRPTPAQKSKRFY